MEITAFVWDSHIKQRNAGLSRSSNPYLIRAWIQAVKIKCLCAGCSLSNTKHNTDELEHKIW